MANTYTQLYIQFVFAVQFRRSLIQPDWETELHRYITGIVQNHGHKLININGIEDHIHTFVGLHTTQSISELMRVVKGESSEWINNRHFTKYKFNWQEGYGAFSYSRRDIDRVYKYIQNQKVHHKKEKFLTEYTSLLEEFGIDYDDRYVFKEPC